MQSKTPFCGGFIRVDQSKTLISISILVLIAGCGTNAPEQRSSSQPSPAATSPDQSQHEPESPAASHAQSSAARVTKATTSGATSKPAGVAPLKTKKDNSARSSTVAKPVAPAVTSQQVQQWLEQWSGGSQAAREEAERQLIDAGDLGIARIAKILADGPPQLRVAGATYLNDHIGARNRDAIVALGRCLASADPALRHAAFQALESLPTSTLAKLVPGLMTLATNGKESETYRVRTLRTVGRIGQAAEPAVDTLEKIARSDTNLRVRRAALATIGKVAKPEQAEQFYVQVLRSDDPIELRRSIPMRLSRVASTDKTIEALAATFDDPDDALRKQASMALVAIGKPTVKTLIATLKHPRVQRQRYAIYTLGKLGPLAKDAVPALEKLRHAPNPQVSQLAQAALKLIRGR